MVATNQLEPWPLAPQNDHIPMIFPPTAPKRSDTIGINQSRSTRQSKFWTNAVLAAIVLAAIVLLSACNGGLRPTLVQDAAPTPLPALQLDLPPAPAGTLPLAPASPEFPLEATVDDALVAWAVDRSIPYVDSCALVTPGPGQLCDSPTERDTVRLVGPSPDEIWYIVTLEETDSFDFGVGFRVGQVEIAGS